MKGTTQQKARGAESPKIPVSRPTTSREPHKGEVALKAIYIYIDDWISSTDIDGMSAAQERGFFRFLLHQSKSDSGKLVKNDRQLGTKTRLGTRGWRDFLSEYSYLFIQDKGLIWNEKQYQGWLRQSRKSEQARDAARIRHAKPDAPALADAHAPAPAARSARLKDLETSISQEKERSLSLSLPESNSDAKPAQDLCDVCSEPLPGVFEESGSDNPWIEVDGQWVHRRCAGVPGTGGGSRADAGPPLADLGDEPTLEEILEHGRTAILLSQGRTPPDSHEPGQPVQAAADQSARAALDVKKGGDADEPSGTRGSKNVTSGGSQADAGPPLADVDWLMDGADCADFREGRAVHGQDDGPQGPTPPDSHELGQPEAGKSTRQADADKPADFFQQQGLESLVRPGLSPGDKGGPSAEAAPTGENPPTDGAGGVESALTHLKVQPLAGSKVNHKSSTEAQDAGSPVTTEMKPPKFKGGGTVPNPGKPGPAPTPTEDEFFNEKIYRWWIDLGGSCADPGRAYQAFMGAEALFARYVDVFGLHPDEVRRQARALLETSLLMWTAYFGLPPVGWELEFWLRDKLNPGANMAPRERFEKPQTTAERIAEL